MHRSEPIQILRRGPTRLLPSPDADVLLAFLHSRSIRSRAPLAGNETKSSDNELNSSTLFIHRSGLLPCPLHADKLYRNWLHVQLPSVQRPRDPSFVHNGYLDLALRVDLDRRDYDKRQIP